jgi:hypothetical protein
MIEIRDEELWGKIISEEMASINGNRALTTVETIRFVNTLAKAAVRVEQSGAFMDFDQANGKLLIWSDSNEIYEVNGDKTCQCIAFRNGRVCWHRAAKRLVSRYLLAESIEKVVKPLGFASANEFADEISKEAKAIMNLPV